MQARSITLVDRLVLRWLVRRFPKPYATLVRLLGRAASGGGLWIVSAGALSILGRRGRRAAGSGLVAYAAAASLANGPVKWLVDRPRPGGAVLLGVRRQGRPPGTSSFPSSHTAAAMAFTVAASAELPLAAPLLVPLAVAVALARLQAVRHHPTDVVAGALLGTGIGAATVVLLRRRRRARTDGTRSPRRLH